MPRATPTYANLNRSFSLLPPRPQGGTRGLGLNSLLGRAQGPRDALKPSTASGQPELPSSRLAPPQRQHLVDIVRRTRRAPINGATNSCLGLNRRAIFGPPVAQQLTRWGAKGRLKLVLEGSKLTVVTLILALSACAPQLSQVALWSKPGASYDAFLQDRFACIQAARITSPGGFVSGGVGELPPGAALRSVNGQIFWPCMAARGWSYNLVGGYRAPPGSEVWTVTPTPG